LSQQRVNHTIFDNLICLLTPGCGHKVFTTVGYLA